jgi:hypothetical protein
MDIEIEVLSLDLNLTTYFPSVNAIDSVDLNFDAKRPNFFVRRLPPLRTRWGLAQPRSHI